MKGLFQNWETIVWSLGLLAGALIIGLIVHCLLSRVIERFARCTQTSIDDYFIKNCGRPSQVLILLLVVPLVLPALTVSPKTVAVLRHLVSLGIIAAIALLIVLILIMTQTNQIESAFFRSLR